MQNSSQATVLVCRIMCVTICTVFPTTCRGTYFARCVVSRNSPLVATLQLPHGVPALLVAKHGAVLGKAHIHQFGGGADIRDEEVRGKGVSMCYGRCLVTCRSAS